MQQVTRSSSSYDGWVTVSKTRDIVEKCMGRGRGRMGGNNVSENEFRREDERNIRESCVQQVSFRNKLPAGSSDETSME